MLKARRVQGVPPLPLQHGLVIAVLFTLFTWQAVCPEAPQAWPRRELGQGAIMECSPAEGRGVISLPEWQWMPLSAGKMQAASVLTANTICCYVLVSMT